MAQNDPVAWAEMSFLIIDDFSGMVEMLKQMLRRIGVKKMDAAMNGVEAIKLLKNNRFDVVLCDLNLGTGKSGQQVLEDVRISDLISPTCIWIMVTAEKAAEFVMGAAEHQPDEYLLKPLNETILLSRLNRAWNKKQVFKFIDVAYTAKDYLKAIKLCDEHIARSPVHTTELLRMKANLLIKCGESAKATEIFKQVLAARDVIWAMVGLAKINIQDGEYEAAQVLLKNVIEICVHCIEAYDLLAASMVKQDRLPEAEKVLIEVVKMSPNSSARQRNLGEVALKLGNADIAEKAFRKSIATGEHSVLKTPDAYFGLARLCAGKRGDKESPQLLTTVQKLFNSDAVKLRAMITEGLAFHESGQWVKARQSADALGKVLHEAKEKPEAVLCLDMAELLFATGNKEAPVELLEYVVKNNHENQALIADVQRIFDKAHLTEKGVELIDAWRNEIRGTMNKGVLLWKEGNLAQAADWLRNAKQALPTNARILLNFTHVLISCIQKIGYTPELLDEARTALLQAEKLEHDRKRFAQLMEALEALREAHPQ